MVVSAPAGDPRPFRPPGPWSVYLFPLHERSCLSTSETFPHPYRNEQCGLLRARLPFLHRACSANRHRNRRGFRFLR